MDTRVWALFLVLVLMIRHKNLSDASPLRVHRQAFGEVTEPSTTTISSEDNNVSSDAVNQIQEVPAGSDHSESPTPASLELITGSTNKLESVGSEMESSTDKLGPIGSASESFSTSTVEPLSSSTLVSSPVRPVETADKDITLPQDPESSESGSHECSGKSSEESDESISSEEISASSEEDSSRPSGCHCHNSSEEESSNASESEESSSSSSESDSDSSDSWEWEHYFYFYDDKQDQEKQKSEN